MLGFPRIFPNAEKVRAQKSELEDTIEEDKKLNHDFKSVWPAVKGLLKNVPFVCICLASASESLAVGGFSTFLSKFVETQFHFTAGRSSLYSGIIVIPGNFFFYVPIVLKDLHIDCPQIFSIENLEKKWLESTNNFLSQQDPFWVLLMGVFRVHHKMEVNNQDNIITMTIL